MDSLFEKEEKRGINKAFILGGLIGMIAIAAVIFIAMQRPSMEDQKQAVLADALREGSPQFQEITKDIIISTGDNTVEVNKSSG